MRGQHADAAGLRLLVVGASSGIGHAVALSAAERGADVAVAARRMDLLSELAEATGGSAFELDVEDHTMTHANPSVVPEVVQLAPRIKPADGGAPGAQ